MKFILIGVAILASACAQAPSAEYLPPTVEYGGAASNVVENNFLESEPSHTLAEDGYRYRAVKRFRFRHRRDVSELSNEYLPPQASAPASYEAAPAPVYSAPVQSYDASFDVGASEPAHTLAADGYRYKTLKRYRLRHRRRRDVSELSNEYLPPQASAPASYEAAPAPVYSAPVQSYDASFDVGASEPAHTLAADGYRYKTLKRYRLRHRRRRDVSELSNEYLPPQASAPASYEAAPAPVYSAPVQSYDASFDVGASEPAHTLAADGYRYKTLKRYRLRHRRRRDVSELSNEYLPPQASAPASYEAAPAPVYSAPVQSYDASFDVGASEPAHTLAADGYRYKTLKRYRLRHRRRRDVSELSNEYLPPQASAPASYEAAPAPVYSAPVQSYDASYDVAASEPAHTLATDGYRYKTVKRYRYRYRQ